MVAPRAAWRNMRDRRVSSTAPHPPGETSLHHPTAPDTRELFREEVVSRGKFTKGWALKNIPTRESLLEPLRGTSARLLEIGSFEGLTACYLLWLLKDATVTCIDTFEGGLEHRLGEIDVASLEAAFDRNIALVDASRVRKIVADSRSALLSLQSSGAQFELVYIDGSHLALDVLVDAALSWPLVTKGGILIFDDYLWAEFGDEPPLRPGPAIDAFLTLVEGKYERVICGHQVVVRKLAHWPSAG